MSNSLKTFCLAGAGLLVIGLFHFADRGEAGPSRQEQIVTPAPIALPPQVFLQPFDETLPAATPTQNLAAVETSAAKAKQSAAGNAASDAGWIGLMFDEGQAQRVLVKEVFPGGPAAFGGVHKGDVLLKVGDAAPKSIDEAVAAVEHLSPGKPASFAFQRGEKQLQLRIPVESLAEFQRHYLKEMLRRDPRDPNFAQHHGVSQADMSIELVRRQFEQNRRLETRLNQLITEVQSLREELQKSRK